MSSILAFLFNSVYNRCLAADEEKFSTYMMIVALDSGTSKGICHILSTIDPYLFSLSKKMKWFLKVDNESVAGGLKR